MSWDTHLDEITLYNTAKMSRFPKSYVLKSTIIRTSQIKVDVFGNVFTK